MDEIASNAPDRQRSAVPWPWGLVAGSFLVLFLFTGIGGLLVAIFGRHIVHPNIPFYFQLATALIALVLSVAETGLLVSAIRWVESKKQHQVTLLRSSVLDATLPTLSMDRLSQGTTTMKDFNVFHILITYISLMGLNIGVLLGFWCLTLAFSYDVHSWLRGNLWPFFVVDVVLGTAVPLIIGVSLVPLAKLIRYVTNGQIETRKLYRWCLPCLGYEQGVRECYWVIDDSFYFKIEKRSCGGLNTILIYVMSFAVFLNSWIFFINSSVTTQYGNQGCFVLTEREKLYSYCFDLFSDFGNVLRVNCSLNSSYDGKVFCLEFQSSTNLIQALVVSIVLYYIMATCISVIFQVVRGLLFYSRTGVWSNLVILLGMFSFFLGGTSFVSLFYLHTNLDLLSLLQLCAVCTCIVTVGILLKRGHSGFIRSPKTDKDSFALTPANPSEFSVPITLEPSLTQVPVEVQPPPSITTEETSSQQIVLSPLPLNNINITASQVDIPPSSPMEDGFSSQTLPRPTSILPNRYFERPLISQCSSIQSTSSRGGSMQGLHGYATVGKRKVTIL